jgi:hypothetical protein
MQDAWNQASQERIAVWNNRAETEMRVWNMEELHRRQSVTRAKALASQVHARSRVAERPVDLGVSLPNDLICRIIREAGVQHLHLNRRQTDLDVWKVMMSNVNQVFTTQIQERIAEHNQINYGGHEEDSDFEDDELNPERVDTWDELVQDGDAWECSNPIYCLFFAGNKPVLEEIMRDGLPYRTLISTKDWQNVVNVECEVWWGKEGTEEYKVWQKRTALAPMMEGRNGAVYFH